MIYREELIPFAFGCAIASIAFLVVDYVYSIARGRESLLNINYQGRNFLLLLPTWFFGAFVAGYFSVYIEMFDETSSLSLVTVGILWPVVLTRIITGAGRQLAGDSGQPEEDTKPEEDS